MVASVDRIEATRVGKFPLLDVLHPSAIDAERNVMFGLARDGAGVTADAGVLVDEECVASHAGSVLSDFLPAPRRRRLPSAKPRIHRRGRSRP